MSSGGDPTVVIGGGPAGLAAALQLVRAGRPVVVIEREDGVGGIARTIERDGFRFDIGGHRFFTTVPEVRALWDELLGADLLVRERRSRILFHGKFFDYPITARSALAGLGPVEGLRILASYLRAKARPMRPEKTLTAWVVNRFGRRLFETFFRPYTEKVWGMRCEEIGAQWAAQRIGGLSLRAALADMLHRGSGGQRTLVTKFEYPRLGPGMLWERMRQQVEAGGGRVLLRSSLSAIRHEAGRVREVVADGPGGAARIPASGVVSTIALRDLVPALAPAVSPEIGDAARALRYRDFLVVALVLDGPDPFPDTWLYLHDPEVRAGRLQNFRAWSPELVPFPDRACIGVEYFCSAGDDLWRRGDAELVALAAEELHRLGLAGGGVVAGHVVRMRDAYPVYDAHHLANLAIIRGGLAGISNLQVAGRNGMHRYNNMDHSMLTGLRAARNVLGEGHDLWAVNADEAYLEPQARAGSLPGRTAGRHVAGPTAPAAERPRESPRMPDGAPSSVAVRVRWAIAAAALLAVVTLALDAHGRSSRRAFEPPPELGGRRWAMVGDAAGAVRVWLASELHGRRALVLTGRWSRPRSLTSAPVSEADLARVNTGQPLEYLDADSALWAAAAQGLIRTFDVVMPQGAFERRLSEVSGARGLVRTEGAFSLPFNAMERVFATPGAYRARGEPVLVLVEPSFFADGAPSDVARWLARSGVKFDLALVALEDPAATEPQRAEALRMAEALGASFLEAQE